MKTKLARIPMLALLALTLTSVARAQTVPPLVNYQGRLLNLNNIPLATGDYELRFSIWDAATGGTLVWGPQVFNGQTGPGFGFKVPVVQGYLNVMLGPTDTSGASILDAFSATNRFVEVQVADNPPITPRQQVLSAPYAFRAASAAMAEVATQAANAETVANVGVATSPVPNKLLPLDSAGKLPNSVLSLGVYDSGWFLIKRNESHTKPHNLGTTRVLINVFLSDTDDGSGTVIHSVGPDSGPPWYYGLHTSKLTADTVTIQAGQNDLVNATISPGTQVQWGSGYARIVMLGFP